MAFIDGGHHKILQTSVFFTHHKSLQCALTLIHTYSLNAIIRISIQIFLIIILIYLLEIYFISTFRCWILGQEWDVRPVFRPQWKNRRLQSQNHGDRTSLLSRDRGFAEGHRHGKSNRWRRTNRESRWVRQLNPRYIITSIICIYYYKTVKFVEYLN